MSRKWPKKDTLSILRQMILANLKVSYSFGGEYGSGNIYMVILNHILFYFDIYTQIIEFYGGQSNLLQVVSICHEVSEAR